jgi:hypothetical protein
MPTPPLLPKGNGYGDLHPMRFQQATWTSPVNNKLLLEGGFGYFFSRWGGRAKQKIRTPEICRASSSSARRDARPTAISRA